MNFFNKATNAVETMGKSVSKVAKDNVEIMKCSSAIDSCDDRIKDTYTEIGKRYYSANGEISRNEFLDLFEAIRANQEQKAELKKRLLDLKGVEICKKCGSELKKGMNFCQFCGEAVEREEKPARICPSCRTPLKGEERFCSNCGMRIDEPVAVPQIEVQPQLRCSGCGAVMKPTDAFCMNCGTPAGRKIESAAAENTEKEERVSFENAIQKEIVEEASPEFWSQNEEFAEEVQPEKTEFSVENQPGEFTEEVQPEKTELPIENQPEEFAEEVQTEETELPVENQPGEFTEEVQPEKTELSVENQKDDITLTSEIQVEESMFETEKQPEEVFAEIQNTAYETQNAEELPAQQENDVETGVCFCSECGNALKPTDMFCGSCGTRVLK